MNSQTKLHLTLQRDLTYLKQNLAPTLPSGALVEDLDYEASSSDEEGHLHSRLSDDDVHSLAQALQSNDVFSGPLNLSKNDLSDLSALYLKEAIQREGAKCFTKIVLAKNPRMQAKTGIYIGEALIANPSHPVNKLSFKGLDLQEDGLLRVLEACNANKNIEKLHLGFVSGRGLRLMSEVVRGNKSIKKIKFQEHPDSD